MGLDSVEPEGPQSSEWINCHQGSYLRVSGGLRSPEEAPDSLQGPAKAAQERMTLKQKPGE